MNLHQKPRMKKEQIRILSEVVSKDLQIDDSEALIEAEDLEAFRKKLHQIIEYLINNDFNRLLNALYRIDVDEQKVKAVLSGPSTDIAGLITDLIMERQMEKVRFRMNYRQ